MAVGNRDGTQLLDDARHVRQGEEVIDGRAQGLQRCVGQVLHAEPGQQALQVLERGVVPYKAVQALVQLGQPRTFQVPVGQPAIQRIGSANLHAADTQIDPQFARDTGQEVAATHVREIADADFRHRQAAAFGDYPQVGALHQSHAAAEDETVHQREHGFAVMVDRQVQGIFFDEERFMQGVAACVAVVQRADIATGTEGFLASPAQYHGMHLRIPGPGVQLAMQAAHHVQGNGIETGGAIEGQVANVVAHVGQHVVLRDIHGLACRG
ncbi:hypothetical protein D3C78_706560 [compost metagenome]